MRFYLSAIFILIAGICFSQAKKEPKTIGDSILMMMAPKAWEQIGHPYPEFSFSTNGKTIDNSLLHGKVVLISFWFEGCHPCMAEMPALKELFEKFKDNKEFLFVSISKDNEETIKLVKEKFSLPFDVFAATADECRRLNFDSGYPTNIILDKTGVIKFYHIGGPIQIDKARERVMQTLFSEIESIL